MWNWASHSNFAWSGSSNNVETNETNNCGYVIVPKKLEPKVGVGPKSSGALKSAKRATKF